MTKKYDELRFELCDPYKEKERWAVEFRSPGSHALKIFVNGEELNALFVALEDKEDGAGRHTKPSDMYGHNNFRYMLKEFKSDLADKYGVLLCCCSDCGFDGCWDVRAMVRTGEREVVWHDFEHSQRPYTYGGLEFHFERKAYDDQIRKLEEWAKQYEY